jgi:hypothetical protein
MATYFTSYPVLVEVGVHKASDQEMCAEFSIWNEIMKLSKSVEYIKILRGSHPIESVVHRQLWENCCVSIIKEELDDGIKMYLRNSTPYKSA